MDRIKCFFKGHQWNKVHGYNDAPAFGAYCLRPGCTAKNKNETKEEWQIRTGQKVK
jgi:hypothetical protein